jgi:hypothetical protein
VTFQTPRFETLLGSPFQHHQKRAVDTFQQHAFVAVETLVKRNDAQVASQT